MIATRTVLLPALLALSVLSLGGCEKHVASPQSAPAAPGVDVIAAEEYVVPGDLASGGHCALDSVNGGPAPGASVASDSQVLFAGWASDRDKKVIPASSRLVLKSDAASYSFAMTTGGERPDVATALNSEALKTSGYNLLVNMTGVKSGEYDLMVVIDGQPSVACSLNQKLAVQ